MKRNSTSFVHCYSHNIQGNFWNFASFKKIFIVEKAKRIEENWVSVCIVSSAAQKLQFIVVPTVVQCFKDPFLRRQGFNIWPTQWVKDLVLLHLWYRLQLRLGFDPWPRNFHIPWMQPNNNNNYYNNISSNFSR